MLALDDAFLTNLILRVYEDTDANGIFDSDNSLSAASENGSLTFDILSSGLSFLQVARPASNSASFDYDLSISYGTSCGDRLETTRDFDPLQYVAYYNDLIGTFGLNEIATTGHYQQFGLLEERLKKYSMKWDIWPLISG